MIQMIKQLEKGGFVFSAAEDSDDLGGEEFDWDLACEDGEEAAEAGVGKNSESSAGKAKDKAQGKTSCASSAADSPSASAKGRTNLPEGIQSVAQWGHTVIHWGRVVPGYAYHEIHDAKDERAHRYKMWCLGNKGHRSLFVQDLVHYLMRRAAEKTAEPEIKFPGTDVPRLFKDEMPEAKSSADADSNSN